MTAGWRGGKGLQIDGEGTVAKRTETGSDSLPGKKKKKLKNKQKSCKAGVWEYQKGGRVAREKEKFYLFTSCFH